jgi:hypothetical protein
MPCPIALYREVNKSEVITQVNNIRQEKQEIFKLILRVNSQIVYMPTAQFLGNIGSYNVMLSAYLLCSNNKFDRMQSAVK